MEKAKIKVARQFKEDLRFGVSGWIRVAEDIRDGGGALKEARVLHGL